MHQAFKEQGVPQISWQVMTESITPATKLQYNAAFKKWWNYCRENDTLIFHASENHVLAFLQHEYDKNGFRYGTFNCLRFVLSLILPGDIGKNLKVRRYIRGISNLRPQRPKYSDTWDIDILISYLEKISTEHSSIELLGKKLISLLSLASALRFKSLASIKVKNVIFLESGEAMI